MKQKTLYLLWKLCFSPCHCYGGSDQMVIKSHLFKAFVGLAKNCCIGLWYKIQIIHRGLWKQLKNVFFDLILTVLKPEFFPKIHIIAPALESQSRDSLCDSCEPFEDWWSYTEDKCWTEDILKVCINNSSSTWNQLGNHPDCSSWSA